MLLQKPREDEAIAIILCATMCLSAQGVRCVWLSPCCPIPLLAPNSAFMFIMS